MSDADPSMGVTASAEGVPTILERRPYGWGYEQAEFG